MDKATFTMESAGDVYPLIEKVSLHVIKHKESGRRFILAQSNSGIALTPLDYEAVKKPNPVFVG